MGSERGDSRVEMGAGGGNGAYRLTEGGEGGDDGGVKEGEAKTACEEVVRNGRRGQMRWADAQDDGVMTRMMG